ncbi:MAG: tetratricopeptide repeat protein [Rhodospirillales bacterium]|nr:tetratricopeptide repeat protein [Rhodospirillales bacterium]
MSEALSMARGHTGIDSTGVAQMLLDLGDPAGALALLDIADAHDEANTRRLSVRGMAHLAASQPQAARAALHRALALGDRSAATLLNLALAEHASGESDRALNLIALAEEAAPNWAEPFLRRAELLRRAGERDAAATAYDAALARAPSRPEALIGRAALHIARGEGTQARHLLLRACAAAPQRGEAWDALGLALMLTGDPAAAEAAFETASRLEPTSIPPALHRAEAAWAAGHAEVELARLQCEPSAEPASLAARGLLLDRLGRRDDAEDLLEAAAILAPDSALVARVRADALTRTFDAGAAVAAIERALELDPRSVELRNNLGAALVRAQRHSRARTVLEALVTEIGPRPGPLCNLANARVSSGDQEGGVAAAREAVASSPEETIAWRALGNALVYHPAATGRELREIAERAAAALQAPPAPAFANTPEPDRRLRLGLLSATLKTHPVGWLTLAGFEALDPTAFEIIAFSQPIGAHPDTMTRRFRALASDWVVADTDLAGKRAERIRARGIDILVDLGGHGDQGWAATCAWRAAPVQIKWVGAQSHTSGIAAMDWFITDRWESPPGAEALHTERLLRMPDGYCCYSPPPYAPEIAPPPALARGFVTFGCFNNLAKITPQVIETWARILARVADSRLLLKAPQFSEAEIAASVQARFAALGIAPARVELRGASPHRSLLGQYADVDIALDPFPYTGGLTTCEALWMGVPVITRPGDYFAARHSASHLANVGLRDWVAADIDSYVERAVAKAADLPALATLRARLRAEMAASPLCDGPRFGRNLATALRAVWRQWCEETSDAR